MSDNGENFDDFPDAQSSGDGENVVDAPTSKSRCVDDGITEDILDSEQELRQQEHATVHHQLDGSWK